LRLRTDHPTTVSEVSPGERIKFMMADPSGVTPDGLKAKLAEKIGAVYVGIEDMSGMCILSDRGGVGGPRHPHPAPYIYALSNSHSHISTLIIPSLCSLKEY
jgi:hypothetical protein